MSAVAGDVVADAGRERVLRALKISGRRLAPRRGEGWAVLGNGDRRRRPILTVDGETVMRLIAEGDVVSAGEQVWVLRPEAAMPAWTRPRQWVFTATAVRRAGSRMRGYGFVGMARQAREGGGAISLRQAQAGLRLIADAERAAADARLTMNWDAGPTTRRRAASGGGREGDALAAANLLRRLRSQMGEQAWRMVWSLCIDGDTLSALMARHAISQVLIKRRMADLLERLAAAYEG